MREIGVKALAAKDFLATVTTQQKNTALAAIAASLRENSKTIIAANKEDLERGRKNGLSDGMLDRLMLDDERIEGIAGAVEDVIALPDPCGRLLEEIKRPNGLAIKKVSVPLGVIGIIYESRPNVTADAAVLCLKSSNAVILRGGKEAIDSNIAIVAAMRAALKECGFDENCIQLVTDTSRESANQMMKMNGVIDCLIPRGGRGLIRSVVENSTVPVIETGSGNCHIYVDESADIDMAANIIFNAKTQRIGVCNACESLVIHSGIINRALPVIKARLDEKNVEMRGDELAMLAADGVLPASEEDFACEYLDYKISVKTVGSLDEAIRHINQYSTKHSEAIITQNEANAREFLQRVDSSSVYVNASTRFTDGGEFGLGAEIGISTQKLHARGPMGLRELTTTKYLIYGNGQIR
ncbi:MAG TPA: glutamate-5-semialdehyde dehydrogenase [Candidatus Eubacterium faecipullorum]|uniref:Gamma-glutamyl phosphate reductase n=1 Tax=Candidatus Eubacterium faecipullorum TaxID=2838571 RepID=A0A9D1RC41_9FIRM|nr:glutamate-5-semialdehyde dehydrogenase [Candidatus Eubacterium faecipullorum]